VLCYPLDAIEAQIHRKRLKSDNCKVVPCTGGFFVREERTIKSPKTGIEADVIIMHGRSQGRHTHFKRDRRIIAKKTKRPQPRKLNATQN